MATRSVSAQLKPPSVGGVLLSVLTTIALLHVGLSIPLPSSSSPVLFHREGAAATQPSPPVPVSAANPTQPKKPLHHHDDDSCDDHEDDSCDEDIRHWMAAINGHLNFKGGLNWAARGPAPQDPCEEEHSTFGFNLGSIFKGSTWKGQPKKIQTKESYLDDKECELDSREEHLKAVTKWLKEKEGELQKRQTKLDQDKKVIGVQFGDLGYMEYEVGAYLDELNPCEDSLNYMVPSLHTCLEQLTDSDFGAFGTIYNSTKYEESAAFRTVSLHPGFQPLGKGLVEASGGKEEKLTAANLHREVSPAQDMATAAEVLQKVESLLGSPMGQYISNKFHEKTDERIEAAAGS